MTSEPEQTESEKYYANMVKDYDPNKPRKRRGIGDSKDMIERLLIAGYNLKEVAAVVNYDQASIGGFCIKTWGADYRSILKKRGSYE